MREQRQRERGPALAPRHQHARRRGPEGGRGRECGRGAAARVRSRLPGHGWLDGGRALGPEPAARAVAGAGRRLPARAAAAAGARRAAAELRALPGPHPLREDQTVRPAAPRRLQGLRRPQEVTAVAGRAGRGRQRRRGLVSLGLPGAVPGNDRASQAWPGPRGPAQVSLSPKESASPPLDSVLDVEAGSSTIRPVVSPTWRRQERGPEGALPGTALTSLTCISAGALAN